MHDPTRPLLSDGVGLHRIDRIKSHLRRAFRHSAPAIWNSRTQHLITDLRTLPTLKRHLKLNCIVVFFLW